MLYAVFLTQKWPLFCGTSMIDVLLIEKATPSLWMAQPFQLNDHYSWIQHGSFGLFGYVFHVGQSGPYTESPAKLLCVHHLSANGVSSGSPLNGYPGIIRTNTPITYRRIPTPSSLVDFFFINPDTHLVTETERYVTLCLFRKMEGASCPHHAPLLSGEAAIEVTLRLHLHGEIHPFPRRIGQRLLILRAIVNLLGH